MNQIYRDYDFSPLRNSYIANCNCLGTVALSLWNWGIISQRFLYDHVQILEFLSSFIERGFLCSKTKYKGLLLDWIMEMAIYGCMHVWWLCTFTGCSSKNSSISVCSLSCTSVFMARR
jgi:hypothetical protein